MLLPVPSNFMTQQIQTAVPNPNYFQPSNNQNQASADDSASSRQNNDDYGARHGNNVGCGGRDSGGGRSGGRNKVQCQICKKHRHDAFVCYHRHSNLGSQRSGPSTTAWNGPPAQQIQWTGPNQCQLPFQPPPWAAPNWLGPNQCHGPSSSHALPLNQWSFTPTTGWYLNNWNGL